jgi:hypothetical protein
VGPDIAQPKNSGANKANFIAVVSDGVDEDLFRMRRNITAGGRHAR